MVEGSSMVREKTEERGARHAGHYIPESPAKGVRARRHARCFFMPCALFEVKERLVYRQKFTQMQEREVIYIVGSAQERRCYRIKKI